MDRRELLTLKEAASIISEREGREYNPGTIRKNIYYGLLKEAERSGATGSCRGHGLSPTARNGKAEFFFSFPS